jgi:hypothetical protein
MKELESAVDGLLTSKSLKTDDDAKCRSGGEAEERE